MMICVLMLVKVLYSWLLMLLVLLVMSVMCLFSWNCVSLLLIIDDILLGLLFLCLWWCWVFCVCGGVVFWCFGVGLECVVEVL